MIPHLVSPDERIVRAIYSPYHLDKKKKRIRSAAYDPTRGTDEISIMRLEHMGASFCKRKALSFENPQENKEYKGFAVLRTAPVRTGKMEVVDSRRHFCGHGDILLAIPELRGREPNEPLPPELGKRVKELKDKLKELSHYVPDPLPKSRRWTGEKLEPPTN